MQDNNNQLNDAGQKSDDLEAVLGQTSGIEIVAGQAKQGKSSLIHSIIREVREQDPNQNRNKRMK